ncbi:4'-phosphopantetheinyl transferase superfamily protein [Streptomyces cocklensis]|uniref:4\'-phosphopantetheinyl transferase Svp n=1 Tax=Actinacidiphila cocklensis TaxID=887465 RepID=A0A9W4DYZ8_9ACTN|nr:4'-phosphopantetheinyl transferase superfamily protein [Actinacidiphila cocklensis]MDD1059193.1 4'-phosphopantetheinyl transferase superfamily protein [Actinacidiphila cocklensis]CAG6399113.1 4\\'-phosphopantetheinyl transferase Svp [Actinacidiphila cocklensis]
MIEHLLPPGVFSRAAYGDELDLAPLHPEESAAVARAVAKRQREYTAGRACARAALARLGAPPGPLLRDPHRGAPLWPTGVVGSITHCDGYRAAAVARSTDILTLGIDAEPHDRLPEGVLDAIVATDTERAALASLTQRAPAVHWDRLLFSAKETVYKAWYPFHRRMLGFNEAELLFTADPVDPAVPPADTPGGTGAHERDTPGHVTLGHVTPDRGSYTARVLIPGPLLAEGTGPDVFTGRWIVRDGLLVTAIAVPAALPAG